MDEIEHIDEVTPAGYPPGYLHRVVWRFGVDTPRYLRERGIFQENPYQALYDTYRNPYAAVTSWVDYPKIHYVPMDSFCYPTINSPSDPSLTSVLPKLTQKWKSSRFNVGVTIGEGRESIQMIQGRIDSIRKAAIALSKRNLGDAVKNLGHIPRSSRSKAKTKLDFDDLSGAWLEMMYGWMPMINDVYNASDLIKLNPRVGVIRASTKNVGTITWPSTFYGKKESLKCERRLHVKIIVKRAPIMLERLGLTDPTSIAWELARFSFIVDWFLPIGNYLESLHAVTWLPVTSCVISRIKTHHARATIEKGNTCSNWYTAAGSEYLEAIYTYHTRGVSGSLDPLLLALSEYTHSSVSPKWDMDLSKVVSSVALLHANRHRIK